MLLAACEGGLGCAGPTQLTMRVTVCQGLCDELEFSDWKYDNSLAISNVIPNARNQPGFSFFSVARDAGH